MILDEEEENEQEQQNTDERRPEPITTHSFFQMTNKYQNSPDFDGNKTIDIDKDELIHIQEGDDDCQPLSMRSSFEIQPKIPIDDAQQNSPKMACTTPNQR